MDSLSENKQAIQTLMTNHTCYAGQFYAETRYPLLLRGKQYFNILSDPSTEPTSTLGRETFARMGEQIRMPSNWTRQIFPAALTVRISQYLVGIVFQLGTRRIAG